MFWFWKMVYGNIFRKPFSVFSFAILRSKTKIFRLTFVLRCNKRLQMLKMFYRKRFQPKQTEPKLKKCESRSVVFLGHVISWDGITCES